MSHTTQDNHNSQQVQHLQEKINDITNEIIHNDSTVKSLRKKRLHIQLQMWDTCPHVWYRDGSAASDDIHKYYCKHCGLYKSRDLYT